jgi:hypothetical protein
MHIKGRIMQLLQPGEPMWEYGIADKIISEYGYPDSPYWRGTIRMTLTDLFSGGLIEPVEQSLSSEKGSDGKEKLLFKFVLTEFGLERMEDSNLTLRRSETKSESRSESRNEEVV